MSRELILSYLLDKKDKWNYRWQRDGYIAHAAIKATLLEWKEVTKSSYRHMGEIMGCGGDKVRYYVTKPKAVNIGFGDLCLFFIYAGIPIQQFIIFRFYRSELVEGKFEFEQVKLDFLGMRVDER